MVSRDRSDATNESPVAPTGDGAQGQQRLKNLEAFATKVFVTEDRKMLFLLWKARHGYEWGLPDFLVKCFDYYMEKHSVGLEYVDNRTSRQ